MAKLDSLVDMIGELATVQTLLQGHKAVAGDPILAKDVDRVTRMIRGLQETAKGVRITAPGPIRRP